MGAWNSILGRHLAWLRLCLCISDHNDSLFFHCVYLVKDAHAMSLWVNNSDMWVVICAGLRCRTDVSDEVGRSTSVQVSWAFAGLQGQSPYLAHPIGLKFFILNQHLLSFTWPSPCCPLPCEPCTLLTCTSNLNVTLNYTSTFLIY